MVLFNNTSKQKSNGDGVILTLSCASVVAYMFEGDLRIKDKKK